VPPSLEYGSEFTNGVALVSDSRAPKSSISSGQMLCRPRRSEHFQNVDVEEETKQAEWMGVGVLGIRNYRVEPSAILDLRGNL